MLIAARRNLAIHHLTVQQIRGKLAVSFDLEVDGGMALADAHDTATDLENAIARELGPNVEVESHIEPQPERLLEGEDANPVEKNAIETQLKALASRQKRLRDPHSIRVRRNDHGLFVHYHCRFAAHDSVEDVHAAVDRIENALQDRFPDIRRVIAHAEPMGRVKQPPRA